jgi:prophage antirepressor-like protein
MTELVNAIDKTLHFTEQNIRVLGTNDDTWYIAKDICVVLGFKNVTEALRHVPENQRGVTLVNPNTSQNCIKITEQAMYKLIMRSNKPTAQNFQDYVCGEILTSIRKTGLYKLEEIALNIGDSKVEQATEPNNEDFEAKENKQFIEEFNKLKQDLNTKDKENKQLLDESKKLKQLIKAKDKKIKQLIQESNNSKDAFEEKEKENKQLIEESNKLKHDLETKDKQFIEESNKLKQLIKAKQKKIKKLIEDCKNIKESFEAKEKILIEESNKLRLQLEETTKENDLKNNQSQDYCLNTKEEKLVKASDGLFNCALKLSDGSSITIPMREDGYINATMLCKAHGKKLLGHYNENKKTKEYLEALALNIGIPIIELFVTTVGKYGGTWVHRKVAIHLAQWLSSNFAVQVSNWIDELQLKVEEKNKVLESKEKEIKKLIEETKHSQDSLNTKQEKLTKTTNGLFNCSLKLSNGSNIIIPMREDGYVNVTLLCKAGGKDIKEWKKNKSSVHILSSYFSLGGIPPSQLLNSTRIGKTQNTFAHPDIAIQIAQWADPYFAIQVSRWTRELLVYGKVELGNEKSSEELDNKFQERILELTQEKEILKQVLENKDQDIKTLQTDLLQEQKDVINTKKSLMKTQTKFSQRHKFTDSSCVYILQDPDCKYSKLKIGLTTDINQRLTSDRTMIPNIKVRYIMYNDHCELFEKAIKVRCKENLELPSHEWVFETLDNLIKIYNEIDKSNGFSSIIETDLWRYNLEPPPSEEYKEPEPVNIPTYYGTPISKISNFLSGPQVLRGDYLIKNKNAPQGQRWCNGWCQCYKMVTDFAKRSASPMTICIYCENMLDVAIIKVKSGLLTEKEIRKDPCKILLEANQQICRKCETIKHTSDFDEKKRQCKQCRNKVRNKFKENFDDIVESEVKTLRSLGKYERDKRLDSNYNRDQLFMISSVCKTGRRESDTKKIILENLINYFDTKDLA